MSDFSPNPQRLGTTQTLPQPAPGAADPADRGYLLIIEDGSSAVRQLPAQGSLVVGRAPEVEVPVRSQSVSRRHARLAVGLDGVRVEDLGSHNGTRRNGELLSEPLLLHTGDVLSLCDVAIVYFGPSQVKRQRLLLLAPDLFRQQLAAETARAMQSLRPLALIVVQALRLEPDDGAALDAVLSLVLRRIDSAALGGRDELWVLLPETDEAEAVVTVNRLLLALRPLAPMACAGWVATAVDGFDADALLSGARAAAEVAPPGQARTADDAVATLRVGDVAVLLADPAMVRLYSLVERLSASDLPVLILGETGTGKELVAQTLHDRSARRSARLVSINCAALSESLADSELFGHERGAFTGATASKPGLLEAAHGGTVFLDELGELSASIQAKLLRVLETKQLIRVGDTRERSVDIRLIAATHRKLQEDAAHGRFRQDLYFRLSSAVLALPPLRDRKRELPILARMFLREACRGLGKPAMTISPAALERLGGYSWPGNVRELKNAMQYVAATAGESVLEPWHLPEQLGRAAPSQSVARSGKTEQSLAEISASVLRLPIDDKLGAVEAALVAAALKLASGNKSQAARLLGVHRKVIERRLEKP